MRDFGTPCMLFITNLVFEKTDVLAFCARTLLLYNVDENHISSLAVKLMLSTC